MTTELVKTGPGQLVVNDEDGLKIPLSQVAIAVLEQMQQKRINDFVFCATIRGTERISEAVFGRLQIPMLRAGLLDHRVVSDPQHPARRFFDTLAQASVNLQPETERGRAMIDLDRRSREPLGGQDPFGVEVQDRTDGISGATGLEAGQAVREDLGQHGDHPIRQIDARAAMAGRAVQG